MTTRRLVSAKWMLVALSFLCFAQNASAAIYWRPNLDAAKIEAGRTGKPLLLHFYSTSCGPCKLLDRNVFSQPQIATAMEQDYVPVKINVDTSPAMAKAYGITKVPTEVILSSNGKPIQKLGCPPEANNYSAQLANFAHHYRQQGASRRMAAQAPMHSAYAGLSINRDRNVLPVATQAPVSSQPTSPAMTTNPYMNATRQAPVAQQPMAQSAAPAVVQNVAAKHVAPRQQPTLPANAMPNSYREQYAVIQNSSAAPAQTTPPVARKVTPAAAAPTVKQVAATAPIAAKAWPPTLPAGTPDLAFDGCCPVSLKEAQKWIRGDLAFGVIHRDQTFLFASKRQQQQFLVSPDAYSPVFSGNDPVKMLDENVKVAGKRSFGCLHRGAFYLFSSKETMERFNNTPDKYSAAVRQAMARMDAVNGTMRR